MAKVVPILRALPIESLVVKIREHLVDAQNAQSKFDKHRLVAGQKLLELRERIEAGEVGDGVNWWEWYATQFTRSRKDAEKLMRMARSDDPEAAYEAEQEQQKVRNDRKPRNGAVTAPSNEDTDYDIVDHALRLVERMDPDQRERFDATYMEEYHV